jgi:hypothetical protein
LNDFAEAAAGPIARVVNAGCQVTASRGPAPAEVWADPELIERALCSLAWRAEQMAGELKEVFVGVKSGRLDFRVTPAGALNTATPAAFDSLPAVDWIEKQSGTIEMEERSEHGVRFRIWFPAPAQARLARPAQQQAEAAAD